VFLLNFDSKSTLSSVSRFRSLKRRRHEEPSRSLRRALRWTAAGMMEAAKSFRRLKAHKKLPVASPDVV